MGGLKLRGGEVFVLLVLFFLAAYILPVYFIALFALLIYQTKNKNKKEEIEKLHGYHCSLRQGV